MCGSCPPPMGVDQQVAGLFQEAEKPSSCGVARCRQPPGHIPAVLHQPGLAASQCLGVMCGKHVLRTVTACRLVSHTRIALQGVRGSTTPTGQQDRLSRSMLAFAASSPD